jgi:hypothetical protein
MTPRRARAAGEPAYSGEDALDTHPSLVAERAADFRWDGNPLEPGGRGCPVWFRGNA